MAHFERRDKAEQLDAWERGLSQYSHRSDSSGYAGRMGLEVLSELRRLMVRADALADAVEKHLSYAKYTEQEALRADILKATLRAYREVTE